MKNNYILQGWLILLLAVLFGAALAGVQIGLNDRIQANKNADTMTQIPNLVPGAKTGTIVPFGELRVYKADDEAGKQVGWVLQASGQGFADKIELLLGVSMDAGKITGLYILAQNETPGLGNRITFPGNVEFAKVQAETPAQQAAYFKENGADKAFRVQFDSKSTLQPLVVTKNYDAAADNEKIDALTGATISSQSVVDIVNKTIEKFKAALANK